MKLIGLTDGLVAEAERECHQGFRAWICEVTNASWLDHESLKQSFPRCESVDNFRFHVPLGAEGTGILADVYCGPGLVVAHAIAPSPISQQNTIRNQKKNVIPAL